MKNLKRIIERINRLAQDNNIIIITATQPKNNISNSFKVLEDLDENGKPKPKVIFIDYLDIIKR